MNFRPYPFHMAHELVEAPESLADYSQFLFEWKWEGIRAQLIKKCGTVSIWSPGGKQITDRFPDVLEAALHLPDGTALDGVILAFKEGDVLPVSQLQLRLTQEALTKEILVDVPVAFMAFDLIETLGRDIRAEALVSRRTDLIRLLTPGACDDAPGGPSCRGAVSPCLRVSPPLEADSWEALGRMHEMSAALKVDGIMIKRLGSIYFTGSDQSNESEPDLNNESEHAREHQPAPAAVNWWKWKSNLLRPEKAV